MFYNWSYEHLIILSKRIELGSRRWNWKFREKQFWNPKSELLLHSSYIIEHSSFIIELRGILNLSAKSIRRRICHVKAYAWNVNFSAFAIEELFRIKACQWRQNALKFTFWHVITNLNLFWPKILVHRNLNFSAFWRHWQALIRNDSSIQNALKFKFHAYAITWQILLRILFALKLKTPVHR